jgi:Raf kinase inhibitor-like YbhB/YbcL family protein
MKKASLAINVLYSAVLFCNLDCSSAVPTAPVTRTQQTPSVSSGDAAKSQEDSTGDKTAETPAPAPKVEDKPAATPPATPPAAPAPLALTSTAFANMGAIPLVHAAVQGGGNQSPPLQWKNAPTGTGSFAIQMVDLDFLSPSPSPFIHWVITNVPATSTQLPAAVPGGNNLAAPAEALGASQSKNYAGPRPPNQHRYEWTIYAIKQGETLTLGNDSVVNKAQLESKSLGKSTLVGTFTP